MTAFTLDFSSSSKIALGALGGGGGRGLTAGRTGSCFTIPGREWGQPLTLLEAAYILNTKAVYTVNLKSQSTQFCL